MLHYANSNEAQKAIIFPKQYHIKERPRLFEAATLIKCSFVTLLKSSIAVEYFANV